MTVWTKYGEILGRDVSPVTIDVFNLDGDSAAARISFGPATALAFLTEKLQNVAPNDSIQKWSRLHRTIAP
jgi:hypothetical protein